MRLLLFMELNIELKSFKLIITSVEPPFHAVLPLDARTSKGSFRFQSRHLPPGPALSAATLACFLHGQASSFSPLWCS